MKKLLKHYITKYIIPTVTVLTTTNIILCDDKMIGTIPQIIQNEKYFIL